MTLREQLRWGGLLVIVAGVLMSSMNVMVYAGYHNATIQAVYSLGFTGLVLACTVIHVAQACQAGGLGVFAYWVSVLSLAYANVATFLILAELAGIKEVQQALVGTWAILPVTRIALYGIFLGLFLLGLAVAQAGVLPRWAGLLVALGMALQLPAQFAMELGGPLLVVFTIGGSVVFGAGLAWIGWALWSGQGWVRPEAGLSELDRRWGAPLVIVTGVILSVDAIANMVGGLSLPSAVIHMLSYTALLFTVVVLHSAQAGRSGSIGLAGFVLLHLGATLYLISAILIMAQLAGAIETNRALMASWADIPVGRVGSYLVLLGWLLFGIGTVRAGVFPRWSGWLVLVGLGLLLPFEFTIQAYLFGAFWVIGALLMGLGIGWMGWTLLARQPLPIRAPLTN